MTSLDDLRHHLAEAQREVDELERVVTGEGIDWQPMSEPPEAYGYYLCKMRVFGEILVAASTWTGYQWANCFPVQERLGWAEAA